MMAHMTQYHNRTAEAAFSARSFSAASQNHNTESIIMDTVNTVSVFVLSIIEIVSIILRAILSVRISNIILSVLVVIMNRNKNDGNLRFFA